MLDHAILRELIERVEKAEGSDRELDAAIMFDLFAEPVGRSEEDGGPTGYIWPEDNPSSSFGMRFPGRGRDWFADTRRHIHGETLLIERDGAFVLMNALRIPSCTASIDAALALVEKMLPGCWQRHDVWPSTQRPAQASLTPLTIEGHCYGATAKTLPLAILSALLHALLASTGGEHA